MVLRGPGERLTRKQTTSKPDTLWPEIWKDMSDASRRKEKQKWAIEKPQLENARRLRGIYFIDPGDEEFKDIMKIARRKLEIPMPAAILCKLQREKYRETCRVEEHKTKYACIFDADTHGMISSQESRRSYCRKRDEFIESLQFGAQIYSYASSNESSRCKGSSGERMGKTRENTGMAAAESQRQKWGDR